MRRYTRRSFSYEETTGMVAAETPRRGQLLTQCTGPGLAGSLQLSSTRLMQAGPAGSHPRLTQSYLAIFSSVSLLLQVFAFEF